MTRQTRRNGGVGKRRMASPAAAFLAAAVLICLYALSANTVYTHFLVNDLRYAYEEVSQMDLLSLDEEDQEILQNFQTEGVEFLITDKAFTPIYVSGWPDAGAQIQRSVRDRIELYQKEPSVFVRQYKNMQMIRLRALVSQDGEEFYVYIRRQIRDVRNVAAYTALYFSAVWLILAAAVYFASHKKGNAVLPDSREQAKNVDSLLVEAQKDFVANISHELKTPLTVISGQVEMLQSMGDEIDRDYYFASIREEIDKMSGMVSELLDITILEHKMKEMEMSTVDLTELMDYMALKYEALFQKNKVKVKKNVERNCRVIGNRMYLEQAVNNYIMNAFQHTAQGETIGISLRAEDMARIGIYNEGEHIPQEDMELIWQGFYKRASRQREKSLKLSNAGLGLYMVKKIVEQHHGECGAKNLERGVEFWIRLPLMK